MLLLVTLVLLPAMGDARPAASRNSCFNNLTRLYLALEGYHADHGSYPPAYVADAAGKPMHSWRVLLLPYLERKKLYEAYDMNEPWDGPNNRQLWARMPEVYACASREECRRLGCRPLDEAPSYTASYVAVVSPETAWPGDRGVSKDQITDKHRDTLLLMEYSSGTQPWTAPVDLSVAEALALFETDDAHGHVTLNDDFFGVRWRRYVHLIMGVDGHVDVAYAATSRDAASGILTIAGGEDVGQWESDDYENVAPRVRTLVRYDRVYAAAALGALAALPGVRLWRRRSVLAASPAGC